MYGTQRMKVWNTAHGGYCTRHTRMPHTIQPMGLYPAYHYETRGMACPGRGAGRASVDARSPENLGMCVIPSQVLVLCLECAYNPVGGVSRVYLTDTRGLEKTIIVFSRYAKHPRVLEGCPGRGSVKGSWRVGLEGVCCAVHGSCHTRYTECGFKRSVRFENRTDTEIFFPRVRRTLSSAHTAPRRGPKVTKIPVVKRVPIMNF